MLSGMLIQETFCPDLKFRYSHESSCSQEIFSLLCRPKRRRRNTQTLVYLYERSIQTVGVDGCCRQDPCSSNRIKSKAALGWKGNCFVCRPLFPPFWCPGITVNKQGNERIAIDLFSFLFFPSKIIKKSLAYHKSNQKFSVWTVSLRCGLYKSAYSRAACTCRDSMLRAKS